MQGQSVSNKRQEKGQLGELSAARFLKEQGYSVIAHNWKDPIFRIQVDLVISRDTRAYIVEVKNHRWLGSGFEQLMTWKQRERLLNFGRRLHSMRYKKYAWGYMWIWARERDCQILESYEF